MTLVRRAGLAVGLAGLLALPVACGGNQEDSYCSALSAKQQVFSEDTTPSGFLDALPTLKSLGGKAPSDIAADWQTFLGAMETLNGAIKAAGVKPSDISDGKQPSGVTDAQWDAIKAAADGLSTEQVSDALENVDQEAKDVCKLQLGLS